MSGINDGGPAFPCQPLDAQGMPRNEMQGGMALRDWFAGQALAGWVACPETTGEPESGAEYSYKIADAMLAERAKGGAK
jgi:hypothetical protein